MMMLMIERMKNNTPKKLGREKRTMRGKRLGKRLNRGRLMHIPQTSL
jgi:hypothetical protein